MPALNVIIGDIDIVSYGCVGEKENLSGLETVMCLWAVVEEKGVMWSNCSRAWMKLNLPGKAAVDVGVAGELPAWIM